MTTGWAGLLRGGNAWRCGVIGAGIVLHALNTFIVVTVMPSVVRDIGGLPFFAWATTLYVTASLLGGSLCALALRRLGARGSYRLALALFATGAVLCATAPSMPVLLAGRFVQGLGAGTLSALSFTMVRTLFPPELWSRAMSVVSAAWGVATLGGPAVGGIFAEYDAWRLGFWTMGALTPPLAILVEAALPRDLPRPGVPRTGLAVGNLALLVAGVVCVSTGSVWTEWQAKLVGLVAALALLALFVRRERRGGARLLPGGACDPWSPLGATYAAMSMLVLCMTTEIFVPYFLQTLHGLRPLHAGYLCALMSAGWTTGSILSSGMAPRTARGAMLAGPAAMFVAMATLFLLLPAPGPGVAAIGGALAAMGMGIGLCWPHLGARIFTFAPEAERDLAGASITIVIMVTNSFGSALGGMLTNLAGMVSPGGAEGASHAASWLFAAFAVAPLGALLAVRRVVRQDRS
jgi:MFS family permease